jgi:hypothetical protein
MADYYNYNNVSVKVGGSGILADSASFSFSNQLSASDRINKIGGNEYVADGGVNGTMSLSYFVDANSGDPFHMADVKPGQTSFPIDVGGLTINSGFLTSYSWAATPHGALKVSANFNFYEDFGGSFAPVILGDYDWDWYKMSDLSVSLAGMDVSSKIVAMSYDESHSFEPLYDISGVVPKEMSYGQKVKSLSIDTYNIFEAIPYTGKEITVDVGLRGQSAMWSVKGILKSKSISIDFGQKIISTLEIEEDGYGGAPTITLISYPYGHNALSVIELWGTNLDQATAVYFNNEIKANEITERTSTYIKVKIPRFAIDGPIRVVTPHGEATIGGASIISLDIP